ncbi:MAG: RapZ C-terminal domain-containing protein, partial [Actinomycetes bacterium]
VITSFGYLHLRERHPRADLVVDVREHLRDPHVDPGMRVLTGLDPTVVSKVLTTPGAPGLIDALVHAAGALLPAACRAGRLVTIAIGCAGGRHRSVVIAATVAERLTHAGWGAEAEHLHLGMPVVDR